MLLGGRCGSVSFPQRFGSYLSANPHFHVVVPEGMFVEKKGKIGFEPLPGPSEENVEEIARKVARRTLSLLRRRGYLEEEGGGAPDALCGLYAASVQAALPLRVPEAQPRRCSPMSAFVEGFSVNASVRVEAHDREGLQRLLKYCARPPFFLAVDRWP